MEENEKLKKQIEEKETAEKKKLDPMSGTGEMCEAYKISLGEAWQIRRVQSQDGRSMVMEPTPKGYRVKSGANGYYVVGHEDEDPQKCQYIPNCRSKYTKQYNYYTKKPANAAFEDMPPQKKAYLCEHHAKVLIGK